MSPFEGLLDATAARVRRRLLLRRSSRATFWAIVAALLVRGLMVLTDVPLGGPFFVGFPLLAAVVAAASVLRRRPGRIEAAQWLDDRLKGESRFSTALECLARGGRNDVERELLRRVDAECGGLRPATVVPMEPPREATWLLVAVPVFAVLLALFLRSAIVEVLTPVVERTALKASVDELERRVADLAKGEDPRAKEIADRLKGLLGGLRDARSFEDMLGRAKTLLQELQKAEADPEARKALEQLGKVAEFLSRSRTTRQVAEALKQGDLKKAADLTRTLAEQIRSSTGMTKEDMERLAKEFKRSGGLAPSANVTRSPGGAPQPG